MRFPIIATILFSIVYAETIYISNPLQCSIDHDENITSLTPQVLYKVAQMPDFSSSKPLRQQFRFCIGNKINQFSAFDTDLFAMPMSANALIREDPFSRLENTHDLVELQCLDDEASTVQIYFIHDAEFGTVGILNIELCEFDVDELNQEYEVYLVFDIGGQSYQVRPRIIIG